MQAVGRWPSPRPQGHDGEHTLDLWVPLHQNACQDAGSVWCPAAHQQRQTLLSSYTAACNTPELATTHTECTPMCASPLPL